MQPDYSKLSDHDLILNLVWTVNQIKIDLASDRTIFEVQISAIKKDHEELCSEVESLKMWKVKVVAYGTAISLFISVITKMFWK